MKKLLSTIFFTFLIISQSVMADKNTDTLKMFHEAGESSEFFQKSYGYVLFPNIGKAGVGIGGAMGKGSVYKNGVIVGEASMSQLSIGFQLGMQGYSQIIFFQDKRAFDEFTSGKFEFGATAQAVAITSGVGASTNTTGNTATASGGKNNATTASGGFNKGMAIFTIAKGGLMYEASIGGQKFKYKPNEK